MWFDHNGQLKKGDLVKVKKGPHAGKTVYVRDLLSDWKDGELQVQVEMENGRVFFQTNASWLERL